MPVKVVEQEHQYDGVVFDVIKLTLEHDDGTRFKRNLVSKSECVVVLTYHKDKEKFLLTKEFRVGSMSESFGFVAGMIDKGETPESAAERELQEETGYGIPSRGSKLMYLGNCFSSSGFTDERVHYYYAEVSGSPFPQQLDHDEKIELVEVTKNGLLNFVHIEPN